MYGLDEDDELLIPAWKFLNQFQGLKEFVRIHGLMKQLTLSDVAKSILLQTTSQANTEDETPLDMILSEKEIEVKLRENGFHRPLKWYQKRNVKQLLERHAGADYSVSGSGKSTTALALFSLRKTEIKRLVMFVVGPKNVFGSWEFENTQCFKQPLTVCRLEGGVSKVSALLSGSFDVFLMTYEQLHTTYPLVSQFMRTHPVALYLDECHKMKGGLRSKTGSILLNLAHLPTYKTIMSGTPMPNSPEDLVSQHQFLYPTIKTDAERVLTQIQSLYVRTTKREMDLTPYEIKKTRVYMNDKQQALYDRIMGEEIERLKYESYNYVDMVRSIRRYAVKMIQLASNPILLTRSTPELLRLDEFVEATSQLSPKLMVAIARAYERASEGKKILIWSQFVDTITLLERELAPLNPVTIYGQTPTGSEEDPYTREGKIKRFKEEQNCFVMIANPMAASEGISLHKACHYQVFVDRNYDSRLFEQAVNRTHRVGLPENQEVIVEVLVLDQSIDETIDNRLDLKLLNMYEVLNDQRLMVESRDTMSDEEYEDKYGAYSGMNEDDLKELTNSLLFDVSRMET